jgi:hypothetical protein
MGQLLLFRNMISVAAFNGYGIIYCGSAEDIRERERDSATGGHAIAVRASIIDFAASM